MRHGNQIGIFWQVGNSCHERDIGAIRKSNGTKLKFTEWEIVDCTVYKQQTRLNRASGGPFNGARL